MSTKRHHPSKSSEMPKLLPASDLHSAYRAPPLSRSSASLLGKVLRSYSKYPSKPTQKGKLRPTHTAAGKSISLVRDPLFDFDSSKEISVLRGREETARTLKASLAVSNRKEHTERSVEKSSPKSFLTHSNSEFIHREQFESQVISLELKLTEQLKKVNKTSQLPSSFDTQFPIYSNVFQEVIDRDKNFGSLLAKVKAFYETWLHAFFKHERENACEKIYEQCAEQLKVAKQKLQLNSENKKLMLGRIGAMSKEIVELSQHIEDLEKENEALREKIDRIRSVDLSYIPTDEKAWKCLIVENRSYQSEVHRLRKKLMQLSLQMDSLQCLVLRMKDRGFPVDELEDSPIDDSNTDLEEFEPIAAGPSRRLQKPIGVPLLQLKGLSAEDEETENQNPENLLPEVDVLESFDRGEIEDFRTFLAKEVSKEPSAPLPEDFA